MDNNELYHYGIIGMRWGVRKDPERLRASRTARSARYHSRAAYQAAKAARYNRKAHSFWRPQILKSYNGWQARRYASKATRNEEYASRIAGRMAADSEKAYRYADKTQRLIAKAKSPKTWGNPQKTGTYKDKEAVAKKLNMYKDKTYSYRDKALMLDERVGDRFSNLDNDWRSIEKDYKEIYGSTLKSMRNDKIKHSGINMRDVMEFAEYLDDCGATLQHAAIRKSRSKYKGGFVNGKNTSEYNHDYYIHNKNKWKDNKKSGFDRWKHYFNNHYIDTDYYDFKDGKVPAGHQATGSAENSHLELVNNHLVVMPNGRARRSSATRSLDPNEPMGTMYTLNNGKTYHYSSQNLHGTGSGGKKDPEFNERNRPHSRKRAEATASGKVFRRPEVYNPLTGEYQSYTLGRGHGNNGLTPNPTKRSSGVTRSNDSDEEREPKNRVGKYRTTNTRRKTRVVYPSSKDKKGTRYTDQNGLEWVKGSDDKWTTMKNNRVAIKTTKELKYGSPVQATYNRLKRKVFKR